MDESAVVEVRNINKHFGEGATRVDALRDVSLDIYPGTVIGLRGPSGGQAGASARDVSNAIR